MLRIGLKTIGIFFLLFSTNILWGQYDETVYNLIKNNPAQFQDFRNQNPGIEINLKGADLSGLNLSGLNLSNADLSYANLSNTNLKESNLSSVNFIGANLQNTVFSRSNLTEANLNKCNATGALFNEVIFKYTVLEFLLIQQGNQLSQATISESGAVIPASK